MHKANVISDLAYLTTPFRFFARIKTLDLASVGEAVEEALKAEARYKEWKNSERDLD
jgi:hypothetical protein